MTTTVDLHAVCARDAMRNEIHWAAPDEPLIEAARRMRTMGVRALLVRSTLAGGALPGILTSKDIVTLLGTQDPGVLEHVRVADVATTPAICVPAHANLVECINLMRMVGVRRMPVLDGRAVIGVLSSSDIFERMLGD